jgi:hypothetical protein
MSLWIKRNSQAIWTVIAAVINLGIVFEFWTMTPEQIAAINTVYAAVMIALRQMFTLTSEAGSE